MSKKWKRKSNKNKFRKRFIPESERGRRPCPADTLPHNFDAFKKKTNPDTSFNPSDIDRLLETKTSKTKKIIKYLKTLSKPLENQEKNKKLLRKTGLKFNKIDWLKAINELTKETYQLELDIEAIEVRGLSAVVKTTAGKIRLALETLNLFCDKWKIQQNTRIKKIIISGYLRLKEPKFIPYGDIVTEYQHVLDKINAIVSTFDLIQEQHVELYDQMAPLHQKGFTKLDPWQEESIAIMNKRENLIVYAPTSSGKTVLSFYVTKFGKLIFVVPKEPLAIQVSAALGQILGVLVPVVTDLIGDMIDLEKVGKVFNKTELYETYRCAPALVGTPEKLVDILPEIGLKGVQYFVFDEIHCINDSSVGPNVEMLLKMADAAKIPYLGLSATIGNVDWLQNKCQSFTQQKVNTVVCNRRFFNLQSCIYNSTTKNIDYLNPLSMISLSEFEDRSVLTRYFQQTPPDVWELYQKISQNYSVAELGEFHHKDFFETNERIELGRTNEWFHLLLNFLVEKYHTNKTNKTKVSTMIKSFQKTKICNSDTNISEFLLTLKQKDMLPCIMFQKDRVEAMKIASKLLKELERNEDTKYPNIRKERQHKIKQAKSVQKMLDRMKLGEMKEKKYEKTMATLSTAQHEMIECPDLNEPHLDFCMNTEQFPKELVAQWAKQLAKYFSSIGGYNHIFIRLLRRGIGLYIKGLPIAALLLVQSLANKKMLKVVISDDELAYGVSMPFRTSIIMKDPADQLNSLECNQMKGRAGRRGIDTRGFVIFYNYSWKRIIELNTSPLPHIKGRERILNPCIPIASILAKKKGFTQDWLITQSNTFAFHQKEIDDLTLDEEEQQYVPSYQWVTTAAETFKFMISPCSKHNALIWRLRRFNDEAITIPYLIPFLVDKFQTAKPSVMVNQIKIGTILAHFVAPRMAKCVFKEPCPLDSYWRKHLDTLRDDPYYLLFGFEPEEDDEECPDFDFDKIDPRIWLSLRQNKLYESTDEMRNWFSEFGEIVRLLQNYCYYADLKIVRILGKLYTRIWWIRHNSSPFKYESEIVLE